MLLYYFPVVFGTQHMKTEKDCRVHSDSGTRRVSETRQIEKSDFPQTFQQSGYSAKD